jgi:Uma2 family endonuclease
MSTETAAKLMNADEFFDWVMLPENQARHYELERGKVVEMSRPGERHGFVCTNVATVLNLYARKRRKGYVLSNDAGVVLERDPDTVRGPDVSYFEQGKKYAEMNPKLSEGIPTLVVEIVSPNDHFGKIKRKVKEYLKAGVRLVWVIDPEAQDVTVYRAGNGSTAFEAGQELTGDDVLPDFRCPVVEFFYSPEDETGAAPND